MYISLYFICLRARGCTCERNRKLYRSRERKQETGSGFKGSRVAMVLIKLVRIQDWWEIKKRSMERNLRVEEKQTKNGNAGDASGKSRPHFPILRQKYYKFEKYSAKTGGSRFRIVNLRVLLLLGQSFGSPRTLWLCYIHTCKTYTYVSLM